MTNMTYYFREEADNSKVKALGDMMKRLIGCPKGADAEFGATFRLSDGMHLGEYDNNGIEDDTALLEGPFRDVCKAFANAVTYLERNPDSKIFFELPEEHEVKSLTMNHTISNIFSYHVCNVVA